jgi:sterol 3beta-glucosyltransferase
VVYTYSPVLLPKPNDWPANEHVAGSMRMPAAAAPVETSMTSYQPSAALQAFIGNDPDDYPVYIGFGSMLGVYLRQTAMTSFISMLHRSLSLAGTRGIVCTTGCEHPPEAPSHVLHVTDVPHDWLFTRCSVIVHHGGMCILVFVFVLVYISLQLKFDDPNGVCTCTYRCGYNSIVINRWSTISSGSIWI